MSDDVRVGGVIEPTVPVANGLLDVARRLAADLGPRVAADLAWVPPHRYVAPLAVGPVGSMPADDAPVETLRLAARELEEFGVQLAPPVLLRDGPAEGRIVTILTSKGDELAATTRVVAGRLREIGLDVVSCDPVVFTLAIVTGEASLEAVAAALPSGRDTPLASWLVGGLCVFAGPATHGGRGWAASRIHFVALRRLGSRR